jgi:hypothetical protein
MSTAFSGDEHNIQTSVFVVRDVVRHILGVTMKTRLKIESRDAMKKPHMTFVV